MPRIKICCISSEAEVGLAIRHGASALGFVSQMPSGPGIIPESLITQLAGMVPPTIGSVLLTSEVEPARIVSQQQRCGVNTLQLCDRLPLGAHQHLRRSLPGIGLIQVIHIRKEESVREALDAAEHVDALLLDSGNQTLETKELGGTGRTHDWSLSARIVNESPVPVFLAGGLHADNVAAAIDAVRPFGIDVCSGVRSAGALDKQKLTRFMHTASPQLHP